MYHHLYVLFSLLQYYLTFQGKINSSSLSHMNPLKTIRQNLTLEGNFEITGPVTIKKRLSVDGDIFGQSGTYSLNNLKQFGLLANATEIALNLRFQQPVKADRVFGSIFNGIPIDDFVKTNYREVQVVTGKKIFESPLLEILNGTCEADRVNNVDLNHLNETVLRKTGDQTVSGVIHFSKIETFRTVSKNIEFAGKNVDNFLGKDKEYTLQSVSSKSDILIKNKLKINSLITDRNAFGFNWTELWYDTVLKGEDQVFITGEKEFLGGLEIVNLKTKNDIQKLSVLPENGIINIFAQNLNIPKLQCDKVFFAGRLNDIQKEEFGNCWMEIEKEQIFTKHQVFHKMAAENILLFGGLSDNTTDYDIKTLLKDSYLIDRPEEFDAVAFGRTIII